MTDFTSIEALVAAAEQRHCPISEIVIEREQELHELTRSEVIDRMRNRWRIMRQAAEQGIAQGTKSLSGLVGDEGKKLFHYAMEKQPLSGKGTLAAAARALAVAGVNSSMGRIVAAPTAGSCGILPSVFLTAAEVTAANEEKIVSALFTAAGFGMIIDEVATTSGAQGGCQAECGSAAGMAAAGAVELAGGNPRQAAHACAIALKNTIGLVCDPVAGLVEVPCVKRNAMGASNAMVAADMALAGIESKIPVDEVIEAMREVGQLLPTSLKETAQAGLAATPTARQIEDRIIVP